MRKSVDIGGRFKFSGRGSWQIVRWCRIGTRFPQGIPRVWNRYSPKCAKSRALSVP